MKKIQLFILFCFMSILGFAQPSTSHTTFRLVSNGIPSFSGSNPYTATVTLYNDATGNGYLPTAIPEPSTLDTFRVVLSNGYVYQLTDVANATFNSIDITIIPYSITPVALPSGTLMIYDPGDVEEIPQAPTGSAGATDQLQAAIATWNALVIKGGSGSNTNITEGSLSIASGNRAPDFGGNELLLDNISNFRIDGTGTYGLGDGAGGNIPTTNSDGSTKVFGLIDATGAFNLINILRMSTLSKNGAFVDGTDVAYYQYQLGIDYTNEELYYATAKSTDPDIGGTGSTFLKFPFGVTSKVYDNLTSGSVTVDVKRFGNTITSLSNPGAGIYTITVPLDVDAETITVDGDNTTLRPDNAFEIRIDNSANSADRRMQIEVFNNTTNQWSDLAALGINPVQTTSGNITTIVLSGMNGFGANGYKVELR